MGVLSPMLNVRWLRWYRDAEAPERNCMGSNPRAPLMALVTLDEHFFLHLTLHLYNQIYGRKHNSGLFEDSQIIPIKCMHACMYACVYAESTW